MFLASSLTLAISGKWTVDALTRIAYFSYWREFVVAFFTISLAAVAPEFFIGVLSAFRGVPELSFGNIVGQNIILMTLTVGLSVLALKGNLGIASRTVKTSATYATLAAMLPLLLILNGELSRIDGLVLILCFLLFLSWLFKREDRFTKLFEGEDYELPKRSIKGFLKDIGIAALGFSLIILSAEGIIKSALNFADHLGIAIASIGVLIVAAGTGFPETYFSVKLAQKGHSWMILGGLMGSITISSTLVLGIVALINPIIIDDISPFAIGRFFLILGSLAFLLFMRTKHQITNKEAWVLLTIYIIFVLTMITVPYISRDLKPDETLIDDPTSTQPLIDKKAIHI